VLVQAGALRLVLPVLMAHRGMKFGIFLAPFHRVGENPTLALNRDMSTSGPNRALPQIR